MGFAKAFNYGNMKQLTIPISKTAGMLWLAAAFIFLAAVLLYLLKKEYWWALAVPAVMISQAVILLSWKDAKYGTIANVVILAVALLSIAAARFENTFRADVKQQFRTNSNPATALLTETDIQHLPVPVQHYLKYTGVLNKPRVKNLRIVFDGKMRSKGKDWFTFQSVQYNFFDEPSRLFFMKGKMFGITVPGYHHYVQQKAVMDIRLFGLIPLVQMQGNEMNKAETVTLFNDMCLMAPSTLIDKRINWELVDENTVKAIFNNGSISITALLHFDTQGRLINFTSGDRYDVNSKQWIPFSTPVLEYKKCNGFNLLYKGDAAWHYTDGEFVYGRFIRRELEYNLAGFRN
jgi:hypothetical protein